MVLFFMSKYIFFFPGTCWFYFHNGEYGYHLRPWDFEKVHLEPSGSDSMAAGSRRRELITSFLQSQESRAEGREIYTPLRQTSRSEPALRMQLDQVPPSLPHPLLLKPRGQEGGEGLKGRGFHFLQQLESSSPASPPWVSAEREGREHQEWTGSLGWGWGESIHFPPGPLSHRDPHPLWVFLWLRPLPGSQTSRHSPPQCGVSLSSNNIYLDFSSLILKKKTRK